MYMKQSQSTARIRPATSRDCEAIACLAAELHQTLGDPVGNFTAERIRHDGFSARPEYEIVVAETPDGLVGYALFAPAYETAFAAKGVYLNDLYVKPGLRRQAVATALVDAVASAARVDGRRFIWWVSDPNNETAQHFYDALPPQNQKLVLARAMVLDP